MSFCWPECRLCTSKEKANVDTPKKEQTLGAPSSGVPTDRSSSVGWPSDVFVFVARVGDHEPSPPTFHARRVGNAGGRLGPPPGGPGVSSRHFWFSTSGRRSCCQGRRLTNRRPQFRLPRTCPPA